MLKGLKQPNCLKRAETNIVLIIFDGILKTVQKLYTTFCIYVNKDISSIFFAQVSFKM